MGFRRRFITGLLGRVGLVLATAFLFAHSLTVDGLGAARVLAFLILAGATAGLWRYIQRTNLELARFVESVRFGDLQQSFIHRSEGSGFSEFGDALEAGIKRLRDERHRLSDDNRFFGAVLDDAPTPLLTVDFAGRVELVNKAARQLFTRHAGIRAEDFAAYGEAFAAALAENPPGRARLVPIVVDGVSQMALLRAATVNRLGGAVKAVAVQPIQGELNAVEIAAQSDLVRVLTHEIMNSMTPVTSLAQTAATLMAAADKGEDPDVTDARAAVERLARRAEGVMHFVESYRQISRKPEVRRRQFDAAIWAGEIEALFRASDSAEAVDLTLSAPGEPILLDADPDLLCQVLINLLRNASDAARAHAERPLVTLELSLTAGGRVQIEVEDNGTGVPEGIAQDIFLPFFTTKAKGTGVGLSLARQIVLAHGGSIELMKGKLGGALFRIVI
jgi:nitrogen fixation/metabolism regulation signal transduction histidine kinase